MEIFVILKPDGTPFYRDDAMGILATDSEAQAGRFVYAREDEGAEYVRYTRATTTPQPSADAVREVPNGMVLVPREPTDAMKAAGAACFPNRWGNGDATDGADAAYCYREMLSAASDHQQNAAHGGGEK